MRGPALPIGCAARPSAGSALCLWRQHVAWGERERRAGEDGKRGRACAHMHISPVLASLCFSLPVFSPRASARLSVSRTGVYGIECAEENLRTVRWTLRSFLESLYFFLQFFMRPPIAQAISPESESHCPLACTL